jgi:hypothetical protein
MMLQDKFPGTEVINASVVGLRINHRKDYVKKYILPLKPDIMIIYHQRLMIFIREGIRGITDGKDVKKANRKTMRNPLGLLRAHIRYFLEKERIERRYVFGWLSERIFMRKLLKKIEKREKKFFVNKEPLNEVPKDLVLAYENEMRSFCDYLRENNIMPVLSTYPSLATAFDKDNYRYELSVIRRYCVELSEVGIRSGFIELNEMIRRIA